MVAQIPRILNETGQQTELRTMLERSIREHSATSEMLIWLCGEKEAWADLITPDLLWAILAALEREQHNSPGRASKLQKALVDDRELLGQMFRLNGVGLTKRCRCAYSQPDTAASKAASTNTLMRWRAVSTPIDSAITRVDFSARMARPSRESSRLCSACTRLGRSRLGTNPVPYNSSESTSI